MGINKIKEVSGIIDSLPSREDSLSEIATKISGDVVFLGNGYIRAVTMEVALKMEEITGISTHVFPLGECLHGPVQSLSEDDALMIFEGNDIQQVGRTRSGVEKYRKNMIAFGPER